jgi:predicted Zn finger-like uncharacterized protein
MNVFCSHCSTGYLLPDHLLGPRGARVRCPTCGKTFVVLLETASATGAASPVSASDSGPSAPRSVDAEPIATVEPLESDPAGSSDGTRSGATSATGDEKLARQLLDGLAQEKGERLETARQRGRVLAEFGPELMTAYEEYRRRLGSGGSPLAFKKVLKELWAVDLITGVEP